MSEPIILTAEAFIGGNISNINRCTLVIAHADLVGTPAEKEVDHSDARGLLEVALQVAADFPELQVGMLNCLDHPEIADKLSVYVSEFGTQCAALIFTERFEPHVIVAGCNETSESFHHWMLGILVAWGYRNTITREEIILRVAYDLAQPREVTFPDGRWDDKEIRTQAIHAARAALQPIYESWVPGFDPKNLD